MILVENAINNYKIKKYGDLAHSLKSSYTLLIGGTGEKTINIINYMRESNGDFSRYQELISYKLQEFYNTDFLDFTLLMGKMFGVYNLYCYFPIKYEVRKQISNSIVITPLETYDIIKNNFRSIYYHFNKIFSIDEEEFSFLISSMFEVQDDYKIYNNDIVKELGFMLMGYYLMIYNLTEKDYITPIECIEYFHKINDSNKKIRVY